MTLADHRLPLRFDAVVLRLVVLRVVVWRGLAAFRDVLAAMWGSFLVPEWITHYLAFLFGSAARAAGVQASGEPWRSELFFVPMITGSPRV
jgi:hypothetical protein